MYRLTATKKSFEVEKTIRIKGKNHVRTYSTNFTIAEKNPFLKENQKRTHYRRREKFIKTINQFKPTAEQKIELINWLQGYEAGSGITFYELTGEYFFAVLEKANIYFEKEKWEITEREYHLTYKQAGLIKEEKKEPKYNKNDWWKCCDMQLATWLNPECPNCGKSHSYQMAEELSVELENED